MTIQTGKLQSGKVKVTDPTAVTSSRYQFLSLDSAEPNLGVAAVNGSVLTTGTNGTRVWTNDITANSIVVSKNVNIGGNLYVSNLISLSTSTLNSSNPIVYLTNTFSYPYNYEIGLYSNFVGSAANLYAHSGVVRNHNNNIWTFFSNVVAEPTTTVNFSDPGIIYDTVQAGALILANTAGTALSLVGNTSSTSTLYARGIYDNGIRVVSTSTGAGNLFISGGAVTLPQSGPGAVNVGSAISIPTIVTDVYGRVVSLTANTVSTTLNLSGNTGSGTVAGGGTLTVGGTQGFSVTASGSAFIISSPQNLQSTGSVTFANVTTGNVIATGNIVATGNINSSGNITAVGNITATGNLVATGNVYAGNITASNITGNLTATNATVSGNITVSGTIALNGAVYYSNTVSTSAIGNQLIDSWPLATYRTARYSLTITDYTNGIFQTSEMALVHNNVTPVINQYGTLFTVGNTQLAVFTSNIMSGNVMVWGNCASVSNKFIFTRILHPV